MMVRGLTVLKHYGTKALRQQGVNFKVCLID